MDNKMTKITYQELVENNRMWFAEGNMKFFGDKRYDIVIKGDTQYFLQVTQKWSDMSGDQPKTYYIVKEITEDKKIGDVVEEFENEYQLNKWLNE
jgi:hypothetical protein